MPTLPILLTHFRAFHSLEDTIKQIEQVIESNGSDHLQLAFSVPLSYIQPLKTHFSNQSILFGAEQMLSVKTGSFTAPIAGQALHFLGAQFTLIGSLVERRLQGADIKDFKFKIDRALEAGILPIVCIGETEAEGRNVLAKEGLKKQLTETLLEVGPEQLKGLHLLYDAEWINARPWHQDSPELTKGYRNFSEAVKEVFSPEVAKGFKLIYAVPTYSPELTEVMHSIRAAGYSLGVLNFGLELIPSVSASYKPFLEAEEPHMDIQEKKHAEEVVEELEEVTAQVATVVEEEKTEVEEVKSPKDSKKRRTVADITDRVDEADQLNA